MNKRLLMLLILMLLLAVLAACNQEGIGGFSPGGGRAILVRGGSDLFTTNASGGDVQAITDALGFGFDTTFDPTGNRVLYADSDAASICKANADGSGSAECSAISLAGITAGVLSYLPDGSIILVYQDGSKFQLIIYDNNWNVQHEEQNFDQFFLTSSAYKVKRGHDGQEWYLRPYSGDALRWVITRGENAFSFTANSGGVGGPDPLPARISPAVQETLAGRDLADITSGAVSPDGNTLVFRTGGDGSLYSLYAMDLTRSDGSFVQLVEGANFHIDYTFSPDGREIAYESNADGRSIWLANADGSNQRQLATNASLPEWN